MKWLIRFILSLFALHLLLILSVFVISPYLPGRGILAYTHIDLNYDPHIRVIDVATAVSYEVTPPKFEGRAPHWTNDGQRLTFPTVHNRALRHIIEVNFNTHETHNLTSRWGFESVPIYSPIDSRIIFPARANLTLMPILMVDGVNPQAEPVEILPRARHDVAWSPDGRYLAYITTPQQQDTNQLAEVRSNVVTPTLFTLNLETGEIINRLEGLPNLTSPVWSPDSTKIAITTSTTTSGNLQIIDITTGETTPLLSAERVQHPVWSPDGQRIAYDARENGDYEIFVMDLATGETQNISQSPSFDMHPTWSADGTRIAYISHRNGQNDIYVVHVESEGIYRLTFTPDDEDEVTWQPR